VASDARVDGCVPPHGPSRGAACQRATAALLPTWGPSAAAAGHRGRGPAGDAAATWPVCRGPSGAARAARLTPRPAPCAPAAPVPGGAPGCRAPGAAVRFGAGDAGRTEGREAPRRAASAGLACPARPGHHTADTRGACRGAEQRRSLAVARGQARSALRWDRVETPPDHTGLCPPCSPVEASTL
jgi:hypothetical protein